MKGFGKWENAKSKKKGTLFTSKRILNTPIINFVSYISLIESQKN